MSESLSGVDDVGGVGDILVFCTYKSEMHVFSLYETYKLVEIYDELNEKREGICESSTKLHYEEPDGGYRVKLSSDRDVDHMRQVHIVLKKPICKLVATSIEVEKKRRVDEDNSAIETEGAGMENTSDVTTFWAQSISGIGQKFDNADQFRKVIKNHCIAIRRGFKYVKNDKTKVIVKCTIEWCNWRIYASLHKSDETFAIRTCTIQHTCGPANLQDREHPRADTNWVGNFIKEKVRFDPNYKPNAVIDDIRAAFAVDVTYRRAWSGREIAYKEIHGADGYSFNKLRGFCNELKSSNPGTVADLEVIPDTRKFKRVFIALAGCLSGFKEGCRPLLFLDGAHIKSKWKGCLLSVVAKDANGGFLTVAFAVVDAENDLNWEWFCVKLKHAIEGEGGPHPWHRCTFFSDRHSGLMKAIPAIFEGSHHAICLRHLVDNFKSQVLRLYPFKNKEYWVGILNKAAYAPTHQEFKENVNSILTAMPRAESFILNSEPSRWANAMFTGNRWGVINNNLAEIWNSWVLKARSMPPYAMLDEIRKKIMKMINEKRENGVKMTSVLCPEPARILEENYMASGHFEVQRMWGSLFEVRGGENKYAVDVENRRCACGYWQLLRIPCKHACACIEKMHGNVIEYCDPCYTVESYMRTYDRPIFPMTTMSSNAHDYDDGLGFVRPPTVHVQPGRRKTSQYPSQVETSNLRCSLCKRPGHNRRTCKNAWEV